MTAAGVAAEQVVYGDHQWDRGEYVMFFSLASPDLLEELYDEACRILRMNLSAVKALADILMERRRLRGLRPIAEVIDAARGSPDA